MTGNKFDLKKQNNIKIYVPYKISCLVQNKIAQNEIFGVFASLKEIFILLSEIFLN